MAWAWLIRHGQSEANAGQRSSSPQEIALTALGREQAEAVARAFARAPERIVHSGYLRAVQSSAPTCARFPQVPVEAWPVQEFTYLASSRCRDTTSAERLPMVREYWSRGDPDWRDGPGAESFRTFIGRVDAALARLRDGESTAVFTHGQFMQACLWRLQAGAREVDRASMRTCREIMLATPVPNAAILELELDHQASRIGGLSTAHLGNLPISY